MSKNEKNKQGFTFKGKVVFFATANFHKFNEARCILSQYGITVAMLKIKGVEIQSENLIEIAQAAAENASRQFCLPIFVEDAGLFTETLNGFPGPYAAYVYKTIGNAGVLKLMENAANRRAKFKSAIAYCDQEHPEPTVFEGESDGKITLTERREKGKSGFGFDPIFQPNGSGKSFAEMTMEEKNMFSHRADALRKFAEWYNAQIKSG